MIEALKQLEETHFKKLTPHPHIKNHKKMSFPMRSHLHLMFLVEDLIKVSVLALNGIERGGDRPMKEPERSVSEILKHTLDLIPLEEVEYIDKVTEILRRQGTDD